MGDPNYKKIELTLISSEWMSGEQFRRSLESLYNVELVTSIQQYSLVSPTHLVMIDMALADVCQISKLSSLYPGTVIAMYNVEDVSSLAKFLCIQGVNGMFVHGESTDIIKKGMLALNQGELFFPRVITNILLDRFKLEAGHTAIELSSLSKKEREILKTLSLGKTNNDIAEEMNLSFHTVKTHVYNIYKKLNINNRSEATKIAQSAFI